MDVEQYVTTQNDAWDAIAFRIWNDERLMNILLAANPEHADVLLFPAGVQLTVPERPQRTINKKELPPWMQ